MFQAAVDESFKRCSNETNFIKVKQLLAFDLTQKEILGEAMPWLRCAMTSYSVLTDSGELTSDQVLKDKFEKHLDSFPFFLEALKSVPINQNKTLYTYNLYRAMQGFAEKHTLLICGKNHSVGMVETKHLRLFNLTGVEPKKNVKEFMDCSLRWYGILDDSGRLVDNVNGIREKLPDADSELLNVLRKVSLNDEDKSEYAYNIYKAVAQWKEAKTKSGIDKINPNIVVLAVTSFTYIYYLINVFL